MQRTVIMPQIHTFFMVSLLVSSVFEKIIALSGIKCHCFWTVYIHNSKYHSEDPIPGHGTNALFLKETWVHTVKQFCIIHMLVSSLPLLLASVLWVWILSSLFYHKSKRVEIAGFRRIFTLQTADKYFIIKYSTRNLEIEIKCLSGSIRL